jgi:hypothetical protein
MVHYEEDIFLLTGATSGSYVTGGITVPVVKSVQIQLFDHVTAKAVSSAPGVGYSGNVPYYAEVVGSESGQVFRLRAYEQTGVSGGLVEYPPNSTVLQGLPIHVSYEGT